MAVYWRGQLVVDLYGGYADRYALVPWREETRTVLFSASKVKKHVCICQKSTKKAVGALAVQMLVERHCLALTDTVAKHWPEFGRNGKDAITVEDLLNHKSGLAAIDEPISLEDARNPTRMARIIEGQTPNWPPGTKSGYHAVTFGWLLDQLVRRTDPQGRGLAQFVREEITEKHGISQASMTSSSNAISGIDFHLGLSRKQSHTMSRLTMPGWLFQLREVIHDPRVIIVLVILHLRTTNSLRSRIARNPAWLQLNSVSSIPTNAPSH